MSLSIVACQWASGRRFSSSRNMEFPVDMIVATEDLKTGDYIMMMSSYPPS